MAILPIIIAGVVVGCIGIILGLFLGISGEKLAVETDPRIEEIEALLPGNNCGGCGYAGCSALAKAIASGEASPTQCPVGGEKNGDKIAAIIGVEAPVKSIKKVAFVKCAGNCKKAEDHYEYTGIKDCAAMEYVPGKGEKACSYGCLGYGNCVKACPFDAICIVDGIAVVNPVLCRACGRCIDACPRGLIEFVPYDAAHLVQCNSKDRGPAVMKVCSVGCIGCRICEKNCPENAICVVDNLAHIDQDKCTGCGICAEKCPKKIII